MLATRYGLTEEGYKEMLEKQGGVCAICSKREINGLSLAIDHDHRTGKVRGLLCRMCNTGLGSLGDTVESLETALRYLRASF